jgi:Fanconi anemia group M protein
MIIIDKHEKNSLLVSELINKNASIQLKHLKVADYLIGNIAIERKTVSDFISSMLNKRLMQQLIEIKQYPKTLLMIEGIEEKELYSEDGGINANAIRGMILSILLKFQVPIIFTKNYEDTAQFLLLLEKRQEQGEKEFSLVARKKASNLKEQQQIILEGFPGIGPKTAKKLLIKYKTIKNIINTPLEDLQKDIGKKANIFKILDEHYLE